MAPPFITGHRMLQARKYIISGVEKRVPNVEEPQVDERELLRQSVATDWTMTADTQDYRCFAEMRLQCRKGRSYPWRIDSSVSEVTKGKIRNLEYSLLCRLIRRKVKEDL